MQEKGLAVEKMWDGTAEIIPVKAMDMEHYVEQPDVVLVCVKGYSLEDTIPFYSARGEAFHHRDPGVKHLRNRCENAGAVAKASSDGRLYLCLCQY